MQTELMTAASGKRLPLGGRVPSGQTRRAAKLPILSIVAAVALILDRAGFDEDVVIAGLLHDVVEDTGVTLDDVAARFGTEPSPQTVGHCSEVKTDALGNKTALDRPQATTISPPWRMRLWPLGPSFWPTSCTTWSPSSSTCAGAARLG